MDNIRDRIIKAGSVAYGTAGLGWDTKCISIKLCLKDHIEFFGISEHHLQITFEFLFDTYSMIPDADFNSDESYFETSNKHTLYIPIA